MNKYFYYALGVAAINLACGEMRAASQAPQESAPSGWTLVWQDDFDGSDVNPEAWSRIPRGPHDWNNTMASHDTLFSVADGILVLRGMVNDFDPTDSSPYVTGGVETRGKKAFTNGRLEVRAKLNGAKGAWPAIWLMPEDQTAGWPACGEIDIMERLSHDSYAYQTVHSDYTYTHRQTANPPSSKTGTINPDDFNVYAVEIDSDAIKFYINDNLTNTYPRITTDIPGQFPFADKDWFLRIDMQLGGNWVGEVDPAELPVDMEVDWVKYYQKK